MKEIMAVIRMNKMNQTKKALAEAGLPAFVAREGYGRGKGLVNQAVLDGAAAGNEEAIALLGSKGRLYPKRIVSIVVPEKCLGRPDIREQDRPGRRRQNLCDARLRFRPGPDRRGRRRGHRLARTRRTSPDH